MLSEQMPFNEEKIEWMSKVLIADKKMVYILEFHLFLPRFE